MSNIIRFFSQKIVENRIQIVANRRGKGARNLGNVNALVLHQIGFTRGDDIAAYDNVGVHFVILPNGTVLQLYDETELLYASNGFNRCSVAVEFVGNFPMQSGKWWNGARKTMPSIQQIISGRALVAYLQATLCISHVFAHRQATSPNRKGNCPGPHIWYNVGEWALKRGLSDGGEGFTIGSGGAIPKKWRDASFDLFGKMSGG